MRLYLLENITIITENSVQGITRDEAIDAIDSKYAVRFKYRKNATDPDADLMRYGVVYNLGQTRQGNQAIRVYQLYGPGKTPLWKTFLTNKITYWEPTKMQFWNPHDGYVTTHADKTLRGQDGGGDVYMSTFSDEWKTWLKAKKKAERDGDGQPAGPSPYTKLSNNDDEGFYSVASEEKPENDIEAQIYGRDLSNMDQDIRNYIDDNEYIDDDEYIDDELYTNEPLDDNDEFIESLSDELRKKLGI